VSNFIAPSGQGANSYSHEKPHPYLADNHEVIGWRQQ
jgi:hypothetical protein